MNLQNILKKLLKNKNTPNQNNFINYLEGIGDVLSFEVKRSNNKLIFDGLNKINDIIEKVFELRKKNHAKFTELIYEKEVAEELSKNENDTALLYLINRYPNKYPIGFSTSINQIFRVYESANSLKNKETQEISLNFIIKIQSFLFNSEKNEIFIEFLLDKLSKIIVDSIKYNNEQDVPSKLFEWYNIIIFNSTGKIDYSFNIAYLKLFNDYFGLIVRYVISENKIFLYKRFIKSLEPPNGFIFPYDSVSFISDIKTINYESYDKWVNKNKVSTDAIDLFNNVKYIDSKKDFDDWSSKLEEFKSNIRSIFNNEQEEIKVQSICYELSKRVLSQVKYNNLKNEVFEIGAYCLYKERYSYIRYLWDYKQPSDADSKWIGLDIIPDNLDDTIMLYFKKDSWLRKLIIFEDHHGSEIYFKKYFILLLIRMLQSSKNNSIDAITTYVGETKDINFNFISRMDIFLLSEIIHSIDGLKKTAEELKNNNMLYEIGLINSKDDNERLDIIFKDIFDFFEKLKISAEGSVESRNKSLPISESKISEFKEGFMDGFYKKANMRKLFIHLFKSFDETNNDNEEIRNKLRYGTAVYENRAAFFDKWHVSYNNMTEARGYDFGIGENTELFKEITECCLKISTNEIDGKIKNFNNINNVVMLATTFSIFESFEIPKDRRFISRRNIIYNQLFSNETNNQNQIDSFHIGNFNYNETKIPIYEIKDIRTVQNQILILDKTNTGRLIQYNPLFPGEDKSLIEKNGIFLIDIKDISDPKNKNILESFLPSVELKNIGDEQQQRDYLKKHVVIYIYERFKFEKAKDFIGYRLY